MLSSIDNQEREVCLGDVDSPLISIKDFINVVIWETKEWRSCLWWQVNVLQNYLEECCLSRVNTYYVLISVDIAHQMKDLVSIRCNLSLPNIAPAGSGLRNE